MSAGLLIVRVVVEFALFVVRSYHMCNTAVIEL